MKHFICIAFIFFTAAFAFSQSEEDVRGLFNAIKDANYELFTYYIEKKHVGVNSTHKVDMTMHFSRDWNLPERRDEITPLCYLCYIRPGIYSIEDIEWNYRNELKRDVYNRMFLYLLNNGADIHYKSNFGLTCIEYFYNDFSPPFVKIYIAWLKELVRRGFSLTEANTLQWRMILNNEKEVFDYYISLGEKLDKIVTYKNVSNMNMLQLSIRCNMEWFMNRIIELGINDLNHQDSEGNTSLHYMIGNDFYSWEFDNDVRLENVKRLIELGANPHIKNNKNETPFDVAIRKNVQKCAVFLMQFE